MLKILRVFFRLAAFFLPSRLQINKIFQRFSNTLSQEINFKREAAQADALKTALSPLCGVPRIYWEFSSSTVLVMQRVPGMKIQSLFTMGLDVELRKKMAQDFYALFLKSVFEHGLFHADLHPGNIFFDLSTEKFWLVDCQSQHCGIAK